MQPFIPVIIYLILLTFFLVKVPVLLFRSPRLLIRRSVRVASGILALYVLQLAVSYVASDDPKKYTIMPMLVGYLLTIALTIYAAVCLILFIYQKITS